VSELRIYNYEPAGITPAEAADQNAVIVARQLFAGLVEFDGDTGAPVNLIAESIASPDNRVWTVAVRPGFGFSDGSPVTADSFLDAWNHAAYGPNAQTNRGFFDRIEGFEQLQAQDGGWPQRETLSGLRKIDELTFEVTLREPYSGFPAMVGYSAFFPVARALLQDPEAYREHPVGNGPYLLESWEHKARISLVRNECWGGPRPHCDRLTFTLYDTLEAGYAGFVTGEHDLMDNIPSANYSEARAKYPDNVFEQASNSFSYLGVPLYRPEFQDRRVRQALSLAIDRQSVIDSVYDGQYLAADSVISPNFLGYRKGAGRYCVFDPERARQLLAEAGGWNGGALSLHSNIGGGHEPWLTRIGEQLAEHLGIDWKLVVDRPFAEYFAQAKAAGYAGLFRRAWAPDYAWADSYLHPIFGRDGSANQQFYDNPVFDELVHRGDNAASRAEGVRYYQAAEDLVLEELPIIPLWFQKTSVLYSHHVSHYARNILNGSEYPKIELAS
jgi:ABC-type oligopeptide transport system substrate-binding subunit